MTIVVERQRPESLDRRQLTVGESNRIQFLAVHLRAAAVVVVVEVHGFGRHIDIDVRIGGGGPREVVRAKLCAVPQGGPTAAGGYAVVAPLPKRVDEFLLG